MTRAQGVKRQPVWRNNLRWRLSSAGKGRLGSGVLGLVVGAGAASLLGWLHPGALSHSHTPERAQTVGRAGSFTFCPWPFPWTCDLLWPKAHLSAVPFPTPHTLGGHRLLEPAICTPALLEPPLSPPSTLSPPPTGSQNGSAAPPMSTLLLSQFLPFTLGSRFPLSKISPRS